MSPSGSDSARGEIWYAKFDPVVGREQGGERPCLVFSDDRFNQSRAELVIVLPITRMERSIASHVRVTPPEVV
jgi:mRNA interferase MazF